MFLISIAKCMCVLNKWIYDCLSVDIVYIICQIKYSVQRKKWKDFLKFLTFFCILVCFWFLGGKVGLAV
jgi:hypothetical protein